MSARQTIFFRRRTGSLSNSARMRSFLDEYESLAPVAARLLECGGAMGSMSWRAT
jgi:hypothetical protein